MTNTMPYVHVSHTRMQSLTAAGCHGVQSLEHSHFTARQSIDYTSPPSGWFRYRMAKASTLRHIDLHCRKRLDPMVSLHLHLPTSNGQHMETKDVWWIALHGQTQDGRDANLGHMRKPAHRCFDSSNTVHHRAQDDECSTEIPFGGIGSLYLQSSVSRLDWILDDSH
jgi:hypothetical protein